ncbi:MAG: hypothetical protein IKB71_07375 [Lentisphaeria bacterium]|nr:hypothetical protein [Lentisphaeria bacterium]
MKKFSMLCAAALSVVALPASAALQYSLQTGTGEAWFSVDSKQTVYVDVKKSDGSNVAIGDSVISNIGWYNYNDVASYRGNQGGRPGGNHNNWRPGRPGGNTTSAAMPELHYGDMKTGVLGEFSAGDKIVLWVETTSANGKKETFTMYSPTTQDSDIWMLSKSGESIIFNWGDFGVDYGKKSQNAINPAGFQFAISTKAPPSGQPLPGIIATLLVGSGAVFYLKKRKKLYDSK